MARGPLAGAAGPGKFSVRTDGLQLGSTAYGEGKETQAIKSGAPLAKTPDVRGTTNAQVRQAASASAQGAGLFDPTQRPDEPITAGIAMGPGPGPEALGIAKPTIKLSDSLAKMLPYDTNGDIAILYQQALARGN
jgi:hypothetical protein